MLAMLATIKPRTAFTSGGSYQPPAAGISYQQGLVQFQFNLDFSFFSEMFSRFLLLVLSVNGESGAGIIPEELTKAGGITSSSSSSV